MLDSQQYLEKNKSATRPLVWVVDSAYTGELNARIGLAERLGYSYELIPLPYDNHSEYNQMLKDRYTYHTNGNKKKLLIISGTGEETIAEIADLKILFEDCLNIYLASILPDIPHPRLCEYDLVASPQCIGGNVVPLISVPHNLTNHLLSSAYQQHEDYFSSLPKPVIGLLLGGNTRYCDGFNEAHAIELAQRIVSVVNSIGGFLVISNSRRTPESAQTTLLDNLDGLNYLFFDWRQKEKSFYHALLAHADLFIVTGDSLSMCSEAAYTGKPVLVDLSDNATETYHRELVGKLIDYGAAKLLTDQYESWSYLPLDPTGDVARIIEDRLGKTD
jgi:mitochondrial fission protein ELM1